MPGSPRVRRLHTFSNSMPLILWVNGLETDGVRQAARASLFAGHDREACPDKCNNLA